MHVKRTDRTGRRALAAAVAALAVMVAACAGGGPTRAPGATTGATTGATSDGSLPTGATVTDVTKLCDLIGPGDFAAVGIEGAGAPTTSSDGPGTAYCVYAGESAGTGGIEFDAFVGEDAVDTFDVIVDEAGADLADITIPGVDAAKATDGVAGQVDRFATVVVRKGDLAFTISAPGGPGASARLVALVGVVLARATSLIG